MTGRSQPRTSAKPSIKYRFDPHEGAFFELVGFDREEHCASPSFDDNNKHKRRKFESNSKELLSTPELVSAACHVWNHAVRPLSVFLPKTNANHNNSDFQRENIYRYPSSNGNEGRYLSVSSVNNCDPSPIIHRKLEFLKVNQKISFFEPLGGFNTFSLFRRFAEGKSNDNWKETGLASVGISYNLRSIYGWMSEQTATALNHESDSIHEYKKADDCSISNETASNDDSVTENDGYRSEITKTMDLSSVENEKSVTNARTSLPSLDSDYHLVDVQPNASSFRHKTEENNLLDGEKKQIEQFVRENPKLEICSRSQDKTHLVLAKQEHAFAGAMAGIFVSLCLHPVDTVKTLVQSCTHTHQKSIHFIGRSIISERGITGLYRGITSNIASSAPISALYTFTYESVKSALLPLFSKKYQSLAHCMAGGSASIATSFIFTPSERIKQQMQVGSHYRNCWSALIQIIAKGGLASLYAGWGAVLCRNVPHSIIKFYTYESLKQMMLPLFQSNAQPNTLLTLVCGGLAGSTAAFFTTPFDVVKTRRQTQVPGSVNQYVGVFTTLNEISKHEGLKGLYRGLSPRLVMYMTQGAIFFASYESFKTLLSMDIITSRPNAQKDQNQEKPA